MSGTFEESLAAGRTWTGRVVSASAQTGGGEILGTEQWEGAAVRAAFSRSGVASPKGWVPAAGVRLRRALSIFSYLFGNQGGPAIV